MAGSGLNLGFPAHKDMGDMGEVVTVEAPEWLRSPATINPINSIEDFATRANIYFGECLDTETRPTITGLALATGLPGPTSLIRLGQRIPELRHAISRCMTAVAHQYEQLIGAGGASAGAQFMLKNIPDFDPEDPMGAPGVQFFNDRKEILLQAEVHGAATEGTDYDTDVDPVEVYMSVIKKRGGVGAMTVLSKAGSVTLSPQQRLFDIIGTTDE